MVVVDAAVVVVVVEAVVGAVEVETTWSTLWVCMSLPIDQTRSSLLSFHLCVQSSIPSCLNDCYQMITLCNHSYISN